MNAPTAAGMAGSIGFEPQKTRGMVVLMAISWSVMVVAVLLALARLLA